MSTDTWVQYFGGVHKDRVSYKYSVCQHRLCLYFVLCSVKKNMLRSNHSAGCFAIIKLAKRLGRSIYGRMDRLYTYICQSISLLLEPFFLRVCVATLVLDLQPKRRANRSRGQKKKVLLGVQMGDP